MPSFQPGPSWPKRLHILDISRALAALSVVLWHWQHFAYVNCQLPVGYDRSQHPFYSVLKVFYERGALAVDYFFMLSGFIFFWLYSNTIACRKTGFTDFFVQRFSRLYPLHFLTLLAVLAMQWAYRNNNSSFFVYSNNDLYHFMLNLLYATKWGFEKGWSYNGPVWSVSVEVILYFVFFLVAMFRLRNMLFCIAAVAFFLFLSLFARTGLFLGLSMFFLGGALFHMTQRLYTRPTSLPLISGAASAGWATGLFCIYSASSEPWILWVQTNFRWLMGYGVFPLTIMALAMYEIRHGFALRRIAWIGDITYSSYLLHFPLQLGFALLVSLGLLMPRFYLSKEWFLVFFLVLIPSSYLCYVFFEKPAQKFIRNRYRALAERFGSTA
jgi:peptidoglycan/LPS O-acetylase OafA/YrhL